MRSSALNVLSRSVVFSQFTSDLADLTDFVLLLAREMLLFASVCLVFDLERPRAREILFSASPLVLDLERPHEDRPRELS